MESADNDFNAGRQRQVLNGTHVDEDALEVEVDIKTGLGGVDTEI